MVGLPSPQSAPRCCLCMQTKALKDINRGWLLLQSQTEQLKVEISLPKQS